MTRPPPDLPEADAPSADPPGAQQGAGVRLAILFFIVFIDLVGFGIIIPLLPFIGLNFDAGPAAITLTMAAYSVGQFIAAPLWGAASDRLGRRPMLIASLAGAIAGYVMLGLAGSLLMVALARLFSGLMAGNIAIAFAYVTDVTDARNRARGMGLVGAAFGIGFIFGPALGGLIAGDAPGAREFLAAALVAAGLSALALLGAVLFLPESRPRGEDEAGSARPAGKTIVRPSEKLALLSVRPVLAAFVLLGLIATTSFAIMESIFALWADAVLALSPREVGFVFSGIGVLLALIQGGAIGPLARRFGEQRLLMASLLIYIGGFMLLALAQSLALTLFACVFLAVGAGLFNPAVNTLVSHESSETERGAVLGTYQSATSLGRILGPAGAGAIFAMLGPAAPFWVAAILMAICIPVAMLATRRLRARGMQASR